jgi:predicted MPP superfamily phosphohydrolase
VRAGFLTAAVITAYAVCLEGLLKPLHARGHLQAVLDCLNALDRLLQLPGTHGSYRLGLREGHHYTLQAWLISRLLSGAVYALAAFVVRAGWLLAVRPRPAEAARTTPPAPVLSRRRFLGAGMKVLGGGLAAGVGYALVIEPRWFGVTRRVIRLRGLPSALDGLRAVQLTDIHHGPWLSRARVRAAVDTANELGPDLVLLTGDYVDQSPAYIVPVVEELARLRPRVATVAVLGNHDWWENGPLVQRELARWGIPLLDNTRLILTPDRRLVPTAGEGLALAGVGDLAEDRQDYHAALGGLPEAMPRLLLSHNPDVAEEPGLVQGGHRVDLMISGHTHGGQVRLPFVGAPITNSRYGQKYVQGLVRGPVCPVFICRGVGMSMLPVRLGAFPEIAVLEFRTDRV